MTLGVILKEYQGRLKEPRTYNSPILQRTLSPAKTSDTTRPFSRHSSWPTPTATPWDERQFETQSCAVIVQRSATLYVPDNLWQSPGTVLAAVVGDLWNGNKIYMTRWLVRGAARSFRLMSVRVWSTCPGLRLFLSTIVVERVLLPLLIPWKSRESFSHRSPVEKYGRNISLDGDSLNSDWICPLAPMRLCSLLISRLSGSRKRFGEGKKLRCPDVHILYTYDEYFLIN